MASSDPTWQWCERVQENNRLKLKCSFCGNIFSGGISRIRHHLAGTRCDVAPCVGKPDRPLPPFVRQQCLEMIHDLQQKKQKKQMEEADQGYNEPWEDDVEENLQDDDDDSSLRTDVRSSRGKGIMHEGGRSGRKRRGGPDTRRGRSPCGGRVPTGRSSVGSIKNFFPSYTGTGDQPHIRASMTSKDMVHRAELEVGKWFYDACIPFNAANSFQFQAMADAIASIGPGFKMPSYHKLRGKLLEATVKEVKEHCEEIKSSWKETGCSIMADGWTDTRSRTLVNFLVHCHKDTMFLKSLDLSDVSKTAEIVMTRRVRPRA